MNLIDVKNYFIQPTKQGIYIVVMKAFEQEPRSASIQYDGKDAALFLRMPTQTVLIDYINPTVQKQLFQSGFVIVSEMDETGDNIVRDYKVPLKQVPEITLATA